MAAAENHDLYCARMSIEALLSVLHFTHALACKQPSRSLSIYAALHRHYSRNCWFRTRNAIVVNVLYDWPQSIRPHAMRTLWSVCGTFAPRRLIVLEQHSLLFDCFCFAEQQVFVLQ